MSCNDINRRCFSSELGGMLLSSSKRSQGSERCCACVPGTFTTCHTVVYFTRGQRELSFTCVNAAVEVPFDRLGRDQEENNAALL